MSCIKTYFPQNDTSISLIALFKLSVKTPSAHLVSYNEIPSYNNIIIQHTAFSMFAFILKLKLIICIVTLVLFRLIN